MQRTFLNSHSPPSLAGLVAIALYLMTWPLHADYSDALAAFKVGNYPQATTLIEALLQDNPKDGKTLELKGRLLHAQSKFAAADEVYFQILDMHPEQHSVHFYLGENSFKQRKWTDALQFYAVHMEQIGGSRDTLLKIIYCHVALKNKGAAARWQSKLNPSDDELPVWYFGRCAIAASKGDNAAQQEALRQARTIYGNDMVNVYMPDLVFLTSSLLKEKQSPTLSPRPKQKPVEHVDVFRIPPSSE